MQDLQVTQPMLAAKLTETILHRLRLPLLASPKIDGIRMHTTPAGAVSRKYKPLPNEWLQVKAAYLPIGLDGELVAGDPTASDVFNYTQTIVMSKHGYEPLTYFVFDSFAEPWQPYKYRYETLDYWTRNVLIKDLDLRIVPQVLVESLDDILAFEAECLEQGYEGIMLRSSESSYKSGRSTVREQGLLKLKRLQDAEATITGFVALERNYNPAERDMLGYTKRSSKKENKLQVDMLGALICHSEKFGVFNIGSGFDEAERRSIWQQQDSLLGKTITFKYQKQGLLNKPRFPIFKGFRND